MLSVTFCGLIFSNHSMRAIAENANTFVLTRKQSRWTDCESHGTQYNAETVLWETASDRICSRTDSNTTTSRRQKTRRNKNEIHKLKLTLTKVTRSSKVSTTSVMAKYSKTFLQIRIIFRTSDSSKDSNRADVPCRIPGNAHKKKPSCEYVHCYSFSQSIAHLWDFRATRITGWEVNTDFCAISHHQHTVMMCSLLPQHILQHNKTMTMTALIVQTLTGVHKKYFWYDYLGVNSQQHTKVYYTGDRFYISNFFQIAWNF